MKQKKHCENFKKRRNKKDSEKRQRQKLRVNELQKRSGCRKKKLRKKGFEFRQRNNNENFKKRGNKKDSEKRLRQRQKLSVKDSLT